MTEGLHHAHKRKRIHQKKELYPHPNKWKRILDKIIYIVGIMGPIMTIPQVLRIWIEKNAAGVTIITWFSWLIIGIFWLTYGIVHKEKPIILVYSSWIIIHTLVVIGASMYGGSLF